ncbi:hypothetical protein [Micromonospora sp. NBC_01796]|uniref:hypothetical protein n=1 Tax=Micromonospora sp. NBC_01796 TaxID=2975987 RepID=UPI002DDB7A33|nr:hypothetical protein [Micromonospora sp. NBC_01796]WSA84470.1 hypothetical protein OIE47_29550 [Micromonospora sp. NBC_01796]
MTDEQNPRRSPRPGRARKRAIRGEAARTGVAYSIAARQLEAAGLAPGETLSSYGRTIYPVGSDSHRRLVIERRERRSLDQRVADTRRAAALPDGRAQHLVERFPPTRGRRGTGVGPLYHGGGREELLAMLYVVVAAESPGLLPAVGDLVWIAEMGEETAVDMACAELDREARGLLDREPAELWSAVERALAAAERNADWQIRQESIRLAALLHTMMTPRMGRAGEVYVEGMPLVGVGQILDTLLIVADDGHAPGTRVRLLHQPHVGRTATITGALWGRSGPPVGYRIWLDRARSAESARADDLAVLPDQDLLPSSTGFPAPTVPD